MGDLGVDTAEQDDARGLLVVNADDFGASPATTDAIVECARKGTITSATAMMFMADSGRAAAMASEARLDVGLHVNLTQPYTAADVPPPIAHRHAKVIRHFRPPVRRRTLQWIYDPRIRRDVEAVIADQIDEFRARFQAAPTHVDGHEHVHVCPNVFLARTIPRGTKARSGVSRYPLRRGPLGVARAARHWAMGKRLDPLPYFFSIRSLHPRFGGAGLADALSLARAAPVEIMVHPGVGDEHEVLVSDRWRDELAGLRLGSYADYRG